MGRSAPLVRALAALVALAGLPRPASAQSLEAQLAFGQGLVGRGYFDLAEEFYLKQRDGSSRPGEKIAYELGLLQVKSESVERAPGDKRTEAVDAAIKAFEAFLKQYGAQAEAQQARFDIGELLSRKGKILSDLAKRENKRELFGAAETAFQQAEAYLQEIVSQFTQEHKKLLERESLDPNFPAADRERLKYLTEKRMLARYYFAVALFEHAETLDQRETGSGRSVFERVVQSCKDFLWDYEGYIVAYDVALYLGRAYAALDDFEHAIPYFEQAWGLSQSDDKQAARAYADIPKRAYYYKAQSLIGKGDRMKDKKLYEDAMRAMDKLFQVYPEAKGEDIGKACRLEQANAFLGLGQREKAIDIYNAFIQEGGKWAYIAQKRIREVGEGASGALPMDLRLAAADGLMAEQKYREAVKQYREIVRDCRQPADRERHVPTCFYKIGMCYLYEDRYQEACIAFEVLEKFPKHPKAEDAGENRIRALNSLQRYAEEAGPAAVKRWEEEFKLAVDGFLRQFPGSRIAQEMFYFRAVEEERKGNFLEASKRYEQVPKEAKSYEKALAYVGNCYYRHADQLWEAYRKERTKIAAQMAEQRKAARQPPLPEAELEKMADAQLEARRAEPRSFFARAEAKLKEYVAFATAQAKPADAKAADARKVALLAARYYLSRLYLHEAVRKPAGVLEALKDVEKDYREKQYDGQLALILESRLKAALQLQKLDDGTPDSARKTFDLLRERYPVSGARAITRSAEDIAWGYDQQATALEADAKKREEAAAARQKALDALRKTEKAGSAKLAAAEKELAAAQGEVRRLRERSLAAEREASSFFHFWISRRIDLGEDIKPLNLDGVGNKLFELAEKSPPGRARNDLTKQALDMFVALWAQMEMHLNGQGGPLEGIPEDDYWKTQWRQAKCYAALGQYDSALLVYDALVKDPKRKNQGFLYEEKAAVHVRYGDELWTRDRKKASEQFDAARKIYGQLIVRIDPLAEPPPPKEAFRVYWQANLAYIQIYVKMNDAESAMRRILQVKNLYPKMDGNEFGFQSGVEAIEKELQAKLPATKKP